MNNNKRARINTWDVTTACSQQDGISTPNMVAVCTTKGSSNGCHLLSMAHELNVSKHLHFLI